MESTSPGALKSLVQTLTRQRPPDGAMPLLAAFAQVPDPRRGQGRRFPLAAVLSLAVAAILANHRSVLAIAQWGAGQSRAVLTALGFPTEVTPHQTTLQRLFCRLDPEALSVALASAVASVTSPPTRPRGSQGVAIDGKAHRGRLVGPEATPQTVHAASLCTHQSALVLAQAPIQATSEQVEAELTVASALLARIDWRGRVLTGDALYCHRHLCDQVLAAGGDYLFTVKANQPTLLDAIQFLFDPPPGHPSLAQLTDRRSARQATKGHGRIEVRELIASTDLATSPTIDWPGLAQVFRLERTWQAQGHSHSAVHYGLTSLPKTVADPARLLVLHRGHWTIENRLHHVLDVTLGEDQSRVRRAHGPLIMAWLRHAALTLLHHAGCFTIAAALRYLSGHPDHLLALLHLPAAQHA
jgi:predicted transposase YbfD/YdcC